MDTTQRTNGRPGVPYRQAFRLRAPHRGPRRDDVPGRGTVILAHLASLLSVGALIVILTFGSIVLATRRIGANADAGPAATARDDGGGSHAITTETGTGSTR